MSDSEDSPVATSNPPTASAVKSKNSKGTRKSTGQTQSSGQGRSWDGGGSIEKETKGGAELHLQSLAADIQYEQRGFSDSGG